MSIKNVRTLGASAVGVNQLDLECPFCHTRILPDFLFYHEGKVFSQCANSACNKHFIIDNNNYSVELNATPKRATFSVIINELSSSFEEIYNQAYMAEQYCLNQICGVGYRKALEFLIKDYLIANSQDEKEIDSIKKELLGQCISKRVENLNIKNVASRAAWLGNDETHYIRKWVDKDVQNLKSLIDLTIRWIESEIETKQLLTEMPENKSMFPLTDK